MLVDKRELTFRARPAFVLDKAVLAIELRDVEGSVTFKVNQRNANPRNTRAIKP